MPMAPPPLSGEEIIPLLTLILIPWCFHESGDGKGNRIIPTGPGLLPTQQTLLTAPLWAPGNKLSSFSVQKLVCASLGRPWISGAGPQGPEISSPESTSCHQEGSSASSILTHLVSPCTASHRLCSLEFYSTTLTPRPLQTVHPGMWAQVKWWKMSRHPQRVLPTKPPRSVSSPRLCPCLSTWVHLGDYSSPEQKYRQRGAAPPSHTEKSDCNVCDFP